MTDIAISHQSSVSPLYNWGVLGPVSNTSAVQITAIQLAILLLCAGLLVGLFFWRHRKRMLAIRELADRLGFTYIGQGYLAPSA